MENEKRNLIFAIIIIAVGYVAMLIASIFALGWVSATVIVFTLFSAITIYIINFKDDLMVKIFLFGIAAGIIELIFVDPWGVNTGSLVYNPGGIFLFKSPLYMPFSWAVAIWQLGFFAIYFEKKWGLLKTTIILGIVGGINIPMYEHFAKNANWWYYQNSPMVFNTPYYVILSEFFISLVLPAAVLFFSKKKWYWSALTGIALGFWMWVAGLLCYALVG